MSILLNSRVYVHRKMILFKPHKNASRHRSSIRQKRVRKWSSVAMWKHRPGYVFALAVQCSNNMYNEQVRVHSQITTARYQFKLVILMEDRRKRQRNPSRSLALSVYVNEHLFASESDVTSDLILIWNCWGFVHRNPSLSRSFSFYVNEHLFATWLFGRESDVTSSKLMLI